jgi:hypothetical protein
MARFRATPYAKRPISRLPASAEKAEAMGEPLSTRSARPSIEVRSFQRADGDAHGGAGRQDEDPGGKVLDELKIEQPVRRDSCTCVQQQFRLEHHAGVVAKPFRAEVDGARAGPGLG